MTPLAGRSIVITRPEKQAVELAALIERSGGRAIRFPSLEIATHDDTALNDVVDRIDRYDLAIFISGNAVEHGLARVRRSRTWPTGLAIAAIGEATRERLAGEGFVDVISPDGAADTESLLAQPQLQSVQGKRIVIFRGVGGRETLAEGLRARGAFVDYAECYRRIRPVADPKPVIDAWSSRSLHAVTVSSAEGLANLDSLLGVSGKPILRDTPLFVPHSRVADAARALGCAKVVVAGAADEAMLASLVAYFGDSG